MHYSFSSVYMAILTSSILLIVISLCLRSTKIMINAGYKLLALLMGFTFLRFLFPFELSFTFSLKIPTFLSTIVHFFRFRFYYIGDYGISLWTLLEIIWWVGMLVALKQYCNLRVLTAQLVSYGKDLTNCDPYASVLAKVCQDKKRKNVFRIIELDGLQSPMLYGTSLPCILLPKGMTLSREDLYYTFSHEVSHHYHHDLMLKNIVSILMIIYWWNPASYVLKRQIDLIIEMRIDNDLTAEGPEVTANYLKCLIHIKEYVIKQEIIAGRLSASFLKDTRDDLTKRFEMMMTRNKRRKHSLNILITAIILSVYLLSYLFVFEAYYDFDDTPEAIQLSSENSYLIDNGDGTYDFYINGIRIDTTDSLEYFSKDIPIY